MPRNADIIHALGIVAAKSRAHAACKKHRADLSFADRLQAGFHKLFSAVFNFGKFHGLQRADGPLRRELPSVLYKVNRGKVQRLNLTEQVLPLRLGKLVPVLQGMFLPVCA